MAPAHGFKGITQFRNGNWHAQKWVGASKFTFGSHPTPEEAAHAYDKAIYLLDSNDAEFNLPDLMTNELKRELERKYDDVHAFAAAMADEGKAKLDARFRKGSSRYRGVSWKKSNGSWRMQACVGGKRVEEQYETEQDAARRFDHIQIQLHGSAACTNFPLGDYAAELAAHGARVAEGEPGPAAQFHARAQPKAKSAVKRGTGVAGAAAAPAAPAGAAEKEERMVEAYQSESGSSDCSSSSGQQSWESASSTESEHLSEADELLDDDRYYTDLYSVFWTLSRQERFLLEYGRPPRPDYLEVELDDTLAPEIKFMYIEMGAPDIDYPAALDTFRRQCIQLAESTAAAAQAAVGTPDEREAARAAARAARAVEQMEDNLPSEKALYTGFARRVAEEAAASQAASQAAEEVQGFDAAKLFQAIDDSEAQDGCSSDDVESMMAELRSLEAELPELLAVLETLDDKELGKQCADSLVTDLLEARRVATIRGFDEQEQQQEQADLLQRLLGMAGAADNPTPQDAAFLQQVCAAAAAALNSEEAGDGGNGGGGGGGGGGAAVTVAQVQQLMQEALLELQAFEALNGGGGGGTSAAAEEALAAGAAAEGAAAEGPRAEQAPPPKQPREQEQEQEGRELEKRQREMEAACASLCQELRSKEYELGCAQREAAFQKLCVYWEGKVAAAVKAKNYGWVQQVLGPDWAARLERAAQPGAPPLFGTHDGAASLPPMSRDLGTIMREMTGTIPTELVSEGLAGVLGLEAEGGSAHAMLAQLDEVTLNNWLNQISEQAAAGQPMDGFGAGGSTSGEGPMAVPVTCADRQGRRGGKSKSKLRGVPARAPTVDSVRLCGASPEQHAQQQPQQEQQPGETEQQGSGSDDAKSTAVQQQQEQQHQVAPEAMDVDGAQHAVQS